MYDVLISLENLFDAWHEFKKGKQSKPDVQAFERFLEDNIFVLHEELQSGAYRHGQYQMFRIQDPKPRVISKASVKDRLVHHVVFRELYAVFNPGLIFHSYSSREGKGTHLAVRNLAQCLRRVSNNYTRATYTLKCDVKKFFQSMHHQKLVALIERKISDRRFLSLVREIITSFTLVDNILQRERVKGELSGRGVPIGNITSQIFANIYLHELDWFITRDLKVKHYFRYADDFVIVSSDSVYLQAVLCKIERFLKDKLYLTLHPDKVCIRKFSQGIDFLGYIILPHYVVLRTKTKRRMLKKLARHYENLQHGLIQEESFQQSVQSYRGMLQHCEGYGIVKSIEQQFLL